MTEYQIQASTRRCAVTGTELKPGDVCYSVLVEEAGVFQRRDYAEASWTGPPAGAFSFWKTRVTAPGNRRPVMDDEMLGECFHRLEGDLEPGKLRFRYVLALLLIRRKRMRLEDSQREGGQEIMTLRCLRTGQRVQVIDPGLPDDELETVQDDVFRLLGWV